MAFFSEQPIQTDDIKHTDKHKLIFTAVWLVTIWILCDVIIFSLNLKRIHI